MSDPHITLADGDPRRAAAVADRLARRVGPVTVTSPESLSIRTADAVVVVHDPPAADGYALGARVRRGNDVPTVVADADEVAACVNGASTALLARVRCALGPADRPVPTLALDGRSRVVCFPDDAAALLGADPARATGRPLAAVFPQAEALHETVADVADNGDPRTATVECGGSYVEAWVVPTAAGVDCLLRDVTDRVEREATLRRQRDRLDEFARTVAHDLRNPLAVATGRLDLLAETTGIDPENNHLTALRAALDRADDLVDDTLRFASESVVGDLEPVSVVGVARSAWSTAPTEAARLDTRPAGQVLADPETLRRLFENLFRNAVEHARSDVTVTVGPCESDGTPGFFIADDGPGIPPADRDQVFDRSFSTDGGGVGLAVVQQVAAAHGWTVRVVESTAGGARFEMSGVTTTGDDEQPDSGVRIAPSAERRDEQRVGSGAER